MKRTSVALLLMTIGTRIVTAGAFQPFAGPKPVAVLIEANPWAMVMGADTPRCVLYDNREILFEKEDGCYQHTLTEPEFRTLVKRLEVLAQPLNIKSSYDLCPNVTDQGDTYFYVDLPDRRIATQVYGPMPGNPKRPPDADCGAWEKLPENLIQLYKLLTSIDYAHSRKWKPRYIEVMIWDYSYANDKSIIWPKEWPSLHSDRAMKRGGGDYSIFLDADQMPKLVKFLRSRRETGAVEIDGKKWAASCRYVVPSEPVWRKALFDRQ